MFSPTRIRLILSSAAHDSSPDTLAPGLAPLAHACVITSHPAAPAPATEHHSIVSFLHGASPSAIHRTRTFPSATALTTLSEAPSCIYCAFIPLHCRCTYSCVCPTNPIAVRSALPLSSNLSFIASLPLLALRIGPSSSSTVLPFPPRSSHELFSFHLSSTSSSKSSSQYTIPTHSSLVCD